MCHYIQNNPICEVLNITCEKIYECEYCAPYENVHIFGGGGQGDEETLNVIYDRLTAGL